MCGILGQISRQSFTGSLRDCGLTCLKHRGPDDEGAWESEGVFLGMRRLSIIDVSGGHQPIWNEDRTLCIVYNGELYNFLDLRRELQTKGHVFATRTDTEVALHAFEEWGPDALKRFNGMFALAIWNGTEKRLFLARDRIGEKPLYYFRDRGRLIFASEIKAILADPTVPRGLDFQGMANFLAFGHAIAPQTIYRDIYKLLPGHYLIATPQSCELHEYWDVGDQPEVPRDRTLSEDEYAESIRSLLDDSVRRRMVADVPLGAFLSGGVDSSAIVALMRRHATGPVKTFSLGFSTGGAYNELSEARRVAEHLGTDHHELEVRDVDLEETLRTLVYHYDEPFGDPAGFPIYLLSRYARQHVKVVLSGDGGDELFGGYRRYAIDQVSPVYQRLPSALTRAAIPSLVDRVPRLRRVKQTVHTLPISDPAKRYANWLRVLSPDLQGELLTQEVRHDLRDYDPVWPFPYFYNRMDGGDAADHLNRLMYVDTKTLLVDMYMEKVDKASMAASLEARVPMLDHRLVELAFQIPAKYKIRGWSTKRILKRAVRDLVPADVLARPKHGFAVPTDPWFRGGLQSYLCDVLLDDKTRRRGYFNMNVVERVLKEHVDERQVRNGLLWLLLNFELWHRIYLDREPV